VLGPPALQHPPTRAPTFPGRAFDPIHPGGAGDPFHPFHLWVNVGVQAAERVRAWELPVTLSRTLPFMRVALAAAKQACARACVCVRACVCDSFCAGAAHSFPASTLAQ